MEFPQDRLYDYTNQNKGDVHSVKYDIMNGYIKVHKYKANNRCGDAFDTVDIKTYNSIYNDIVKILENEHTIPSCIKRNILVKVNR